MRRMLPIVYVFSAVALTWPLAQRLSSHVPLGSESAETVPLLNVWTVGWNGSRLERGFDSYWDAPIFHPSRGAFAFSDPQPLTAAFGALFWNRSPALAYNLVLLSYLVLNGFVSFRLLRHHRCPVLPSLMGGLLIQLLPFASNERGVLQLQPLFGPIWAIGALWALAERPAAWRGLNLGLAVAVTFLTSEYFALLLAPALAVVGFVHLARLRRPAVLRQLGIAVVAAAMLVLPIALPQAERLEAMGFSRSETSFARTSAWPADYLRPSTRLRVAELTPEFDLPSNQRLYPGVLVIALAALGVRSARAQDPETRRWVIALLGIAGIGFVLSLGSHLTIGGFAPLAAAHRAIPILGFTRSPFRFAVLLQMALALLAVEGLAKIWERMRLLGAILALLALMEMLPLPERLVEVPDTTPDWAAGVASVERPVVVHLPWVPDRSASSFAPTTHRMLESLQTGARLVNGYSGFFPTHHTQLRELLADFPSQRALDALRALGVDFVVIRGTLDSATGEQVSRLLETGQATNVQVLDRFTVIQLPGGSIRSIGEYSESWRLRVQPATGALEVEALPRRPFEGVLLYSAGLTHLNWQATVGTATGNQIQVMPLGTQLFYADSDEWLPLGIQLSEPQRIVLMESSMGTELGTLSPAQDP